MKALISPKAAGIGLGLLVLAIAFSNMTLAAGKAAEETAWLGVQLQALNEDLKEAMEMDEDIDGVLIAEVLDDSPADEAGLEDGDVVTAIDNERMDSVKDLVAAIRERSPGDRVTVDFIRDGRRRKVDVELGESEMEYGVKKIKMPDMSRIGDDVHKWVQAWGDEKGYLGVHILDFNDDLGQYFKVEEGEGVLITEVAEDSPAEDAGLMAGDVVLEYDGKTVRNTKNFRKYVAGTEPGDEVSVVVKRKGRKKTFEVEVGDKVSPMSHFMDTWRAPGGRSGCGRVMIVDDDGEIEMYGVPGGKARVYCPGRHRIIVDDMSDLDDLMELKELEELHLEDLEDLEDLEEMVRELKMEMKELREEIEELRE